MSLLCALLTPFQNSSLLKINVQVIVARISSTFNWPCHFGPGTSFSLSESWGTRNTSVTVNINTQAQFDAGTFFMSVLFPSLFPVLSGFQNTQVNLGAHWFILPEDFKSLLYIQPAQMWRQVLYLWRSNDLHVLPHHYKDNHFAKPLITMPS